MVTFLPSIPKNKVRLLLWQKLSIFNILSIIKPIDGSKLTVLTKACNGNLISEQVALVTEFFKNLFIYSISLCPGGCYFKAFIS